MSNVYSKKAVVSRAIRYTKNPTGSAFADIKEYLVANYPNTIVAEEKDLEVYLKDAVKSGEILKVDGKYQVIGEPEFQVEEDQDKSAPKASKRKNEVKEESKSKKVAGPKDAKIPKAANSETPVNESLHDDDDYDSIYDIDL